MTRRAMKTSKPELLKRLHAIGKLCVLDEEIDVDMSVLKRFTARAVESERMRCYILVRKWGDAGTESLQTLLAKIEGFK